MKNLQKTFFVTAILHPLWAKVFISDTPFTITFPHESRKHKKKCRHWTSRSWGKNMFKRSEQVKKICKKNFCCHGNFTPFMSKNFQIWDHFFPLLFPKGSKNLKSLDIQLWEVGAKRPLNGVRNNNIKKILLSKAKFAQKQTFFARWLCTLN